MSGKMNFQEWCQINSKESLLQEWNKEKNEKHPYEYTRSSGQKVWWKCKEGHTWEARVAHRSKGHGCPYCAGQKIWVGFNDLATTNPELLQYWNYNCNTVKPTEVSKGSSKKKLWWVCPDCGNEWEALIGNLTKGQRCPECGKIKKKETAQRNILDKKGSFVLEYPHLLVEWNYTKNELLGYNPYLFTSGSNTKVWWKCSKCDNEWETQICDRTQGRGCPKCADKIRARSRTKTLVKQNGSFADNHPELLKEWNYIKNYAESISPEEITASTSKKVWWVCQEGHEWKANVASRVAGRGCPECVKEKQTSFPEQAIFYYVRKYFNDTISGDRKEISPYELDIFIPSLNIAIEYDGMTWHKSEKRDIKKNELCKRKNIKIIRVREYGCPEINNDVATIFEYKYGDYKELSEIIKKILLILDKNKANYSIDIEEDRSKIMALYIKSKKERSIMAINPNLLKEWDYNKNGSLNPAFISFGSNKKIWWICNKQHSYSAQISNRMKGDGCPYCIGKKVLPGFNDICTTNPQIVEEWNYEKNGDLKPTQITKLSNKKVWWKCKEGHEWEARLSDRAKGHGCLYCSNQRVLAGYNDLATTNKALLNEWNYEKNNFLGIKPTDVTQSSSHMVVWWKCKEGHEWEATPNNRTGKGYLSSCPYCSNRKLLVGYNDIATTHNSEIQDWNYDKNTLNPTEIKVTTNIKIWWKCEKNHNYEAKPYDHVIKKQGCPFCSNRRVLKGFNDLATTHPHMLKEWDFEKNNIEPSEIIAGTNKKVWWKCKEGHTWEARVAHRSKGHGCPYCCGNLKWG